eukprot:Trichotokara_eunicae@DN3560_c0_g1_i1.p1
MLENGHGTKPIDKLKPLVRCCGARHNSRMRKGAGFSVGELKKARLAPRLAMSIGVMVDRKRRDRNQATQDINVERLQTYLKHLVLYKSGKSAKKNVSPLPDQISNLDVLKGATGFAVRVDDIFKGKKFY